MRTLPTFLLWLVLAFLPTRLLADERTLTAAGIPDLDQKWGSNQYLKTFQVLKAGKIPLPRNSEESGRKFLQRITSLENIQFLSSQQVSLTERVTEAYELMAGASAVFMQYADACDHGAALHHELAQQCGFILRVGAVGNRLLNEALSTLKPGEREEAQAKALEKARNGAKEMFEGMGDMLSEKGFQAPEDIALVLDAMIEVMPVFKKVFPPDYRIELLKKLELRKAGLPGAENISKMQRLVDELAKD